MPVIAFACKEKGNENSFKAVRPKGKDKSEMIKFRMKALHITAS